MTLEDVSTLYELIRENEKSARDRHENVLKGMGEIKERLVVLETQPHDRPCEHLKNIDATVMAHLETHDRLKDGVLRAGLKLAGSAVAGAGAALVAWIKLRG